MKGTLHKTENGWQVWYHAKEDLFYGNTGVRILPILDHGYVNGPGLSDSDEGQEVEFEIVENEAEPLGRGEQPYKQYAKLIDKAYVPMKGGKGWDKILDKAIEDKATRPLTEDDAWLTMKEGDITVNFIPMPEFYDPKYPDYPTRAQQIHIQIAEECFRKYPNNKELYTTDELKDAYKAGVIDGLKEWTLDSYDRPKYPEVKIICPRCKAIMPCPCNLTWYDIMAESNSHDDSEILAYITKNYNPPTKKQDRDK
jgi:hypothetical protein